MKRRRYVAIVKGGAELILIRMEAVETATRLIISATLGGKLGFSGILFMDERLKVYKAFRVSYLMFFA